MAYTKAYIPKVICLVTAVLGSVVELADTLIVYVAPTTSSWIVMLYVSLLSALIIGSLSLPVYPLVACKRCSIQSQMLVLVSRILAHFPVHSGTQ